MAVLRSWMFAVLVACNVHLATHWSCSSEVSLTMDGGMLWYHYPCRGVQTFPERLCTSKWLTPNHRLLNREVFQMSNICGFKYAGTSSDVREPASKWQRFEKNPLISYFRRLKWVSIPLSLGFAYLAYQQFWHVYKREKSKITSGTQLATDFEVTLIKMLPLRTSSRWWGWINSLKLPVPLRSPVINWFANTYNCNIEEALVDDVTQYQNLGEFFRRSLKPGVRPIYEGKCVVSPVDGTVLHFGKVQNGQIEQVKGITYSLSTFLGSNFWKSSAKKENKMVPNDDKTYQKLLLCNSEETDLYHCIIYLSPGDYHRFHSPADWCVNYRQHFPGELLSVRPGFVNWIAGLFNINERVVYTGTWHHGFFSMVAVGATNVGSIRVYFDKDLVTNERIQRKDDSKNHSFESSNNIVGIQLKKGDAFGEFNLGSTIVLIFEGPKNLNFTVKAGHKIKYGEPLTLVEDKS